MNFPLTFSSYRENKQANNIAVSFAEMRSQKDWLRCTYALLQFVSSVPGLAPEGG